MEHRDVRRRSIRLLVAIACATLAAGSVGCGDEPEAGNQQQNNETNGDNDETNAGDDETNDDNETNNDNGDNGEDDDLELDLKFHTYPVYEQTAGESFEVEVILADADWPEPGNGGEAGLVDQEPTELDFDGEVEVELGVEPGEFAGDDQAPTDIAEVGDPADFEVAVEEAGEDYELTAISDHERLEGVEARSHSFDVVADEAVAEESAISGDNEVPADGQTEAEIVVELADEYANPVVGVTPEFEASGGGNDYGDCTETNTDGVAICSMTSTEPGDKTLEIVDPVEVVGETIEFVIM